MPTSGTRPTAQRAPRIYAVRKSGIHGKGVFATTVIPKGTRIIEYKGQRLSPQEADARYGPNAKMEIVLLFSVDESTVIDAAVRGNAARFINHSCAPNCQAVMEDERIFIESLRRIKPVDFLLNSRDAIVGGFSRMNPNASRPAALTGAPRARLAVPATWILECSLDC